MRFNKPEKLAALKQLVLVLFSAAFFLPVLVSCSAAPPREQIIKYVETAEKHAENKSGAGLKKLIAKTYSDKRGLYREDLVRIAVGYFIRKPNIFVQTKIIDIATEKNDMEANVSLIAAISTVPFDDELQLLRAQFHKFTCRLKYDGDWLLQSLEWQRTTVDEYLNN